MRVLHVISGLDPENGGPTFALLGLAEAQARAGLRVAVLATWQITSGFPIAERLRAAGVEVQLVGPAQGKLSRHPDLAATMRQRVRGAEFVHIHALWEEAQHQAAHACQEFRVPYVVRPCGMLAPWSLRQGRWLNRLGKQFFLWWRVRRNLDRAAAIHFTTATERDLAAPLRLRAPALIEPNGLELSEFRDLPPQGRFRARHPRIGRRPIILQLARLSPQKGQDILIEAMQALLGDTKAAPAGPQDTRPVLVLAGPDYEQYTEQVRALVEMHGLGAHVLLPGMLRGSERVEALVDANLFVLPSRHENFGIVVAEAMAAGAAVLVSDEVNLADTVRAAGAGEVLPLDTGAFASALRRWLADEASRRHAGERGRAFALDHFGWQAIAARWADHYHRLSGRDRNSAAATVQPLQA